MTTTPRRILRARRDGPRALEPPATAPPRLTLAPARRGVRAPRIAFGSQSWGGLSQPAVRALAQSSVHDLYLRVWLFALADGNQLGHAEFAPGALREALSSVDGATGELRVPTKAAVSKAIEKAREVGLLRPESSARCLVVD